MTSSSVQPERRVSRGCRGGDDRDRSPGDLGAAGRGMGFILTRGAQLRPKLGEAGPEAGDQVARIKQVLQERGGRLLGPHGHMVSAEGRDARTESRAGLHSKAS